jgi:hypothetical protein
VNNPFRKFFEPEEAEGADLSECHEVVSFGNHPYFQKLMAYLERGADATIDLTDASTMLASGAKVNTFKEIKLHLKKQIRDAMAIIDRETGDA